MQIKKHYVTDEPSAEITQLVGNSFFASTGFLKLWEVFGGKAVYWMVEIDGQIAGLMSGVEFGWSPVKRFQSNPDGCYSRLFVSPEHLENKEKILNKMLKGISSAGYIRSHVYDYYKQIPLPLTNYKLNDCRTNLIDVSDRNWLPPDKKIQSELRKSEREDPVIRKFDYDTDFEKFITLMKETEKRHNHPARYSKNFFDRLAQLADKDDKIIWLWCEHNGAPATTHINFIEDDMIINWQVYYDKNYSYLKANQYILHYLGTNFNSQGVKFLNLGASPDEAFGLKKYKSKWGGESYFYPCFRHKSWLGKFLG